MSSSVEFLADDRLACLIADLESGDRRRVRAAREAYAQFNDWPELTWDVSAVTDNELLDLLRGQRMLSAALRSRLEPELREQGFHGTFPNYRRIGPTRADYLSFYFVSQSHLLRLLIAVHPPDGAVNGRGEPRALDDVTAYDTTHVRYRGVTQMQPRKPLEFAYDPTDPVAIDRAVDDVRTRLNADVTHWWNSFRYGPWFRLRRRVYRKWAAMNGGIDTFFERHPVLLIIAIVVLFSLYFLPRYLKS